MTRVCSPAVPGAARALRQARRTDVRLTGVSLPAICRKDVVPLGRCHIVTRGNLGDFG